MYAYLTNYAYIIISSVCVWEFATVVRNAVMSAL